MGAFLVGKIERLLLNKNVYFWLSPEGKAVLTQILDGKEKFLAHVESVDELGAWLRLPSRKGSASRALASLLLLKWDYMATAQVSVDAGDSTVETEEEERIQ
jgi:hypothetical protein